MKAMILAAGLGQRMLPLTKTTPKPLTLLGNKYLIEYAFANLQAAGIHEIIINVHHLAEQIKCKLKDGARWDLKITYSEEPKLLDTGGGIAAAIQNQLLDHQPFIVVSADILTKFNFAALKHKLTKLAHLILVPNPDFKQQGDFSLQQNIITLPNIYSENYTYANIGIFKPDFFNAASEEIFPLSKLINKHIINQEITGEIYFGPWKNVGTMKDLTNIDPNIFN